MRPDEDDWDDYQQRIAEDRAGREDDGDYEISRVEDRYLNGQLGSL